MGKNELEGNVSWVLKVGIEVRKKPINRLN